MAGLDWSASRTPSTTTPHPWSPPMTSTTIRINQKSAGHEPLILIPSRAEGQSAPAQGLCRSFDRDNVASLIVAAGGADPVRNIGGGTLRAGAQLRQLEHAIVGPPHPLAALGRFTLGYTHNFKVLIYSAQPKWQKPIP